MSNSKRAKERRSKRSKLKKSERAKLDKQHFGERGSAKKKEVRQAFNIFGRG